MCNQDDVNNIISQHFFEYKEYKMDTEAFFSKREYWKEMNQDYKKRLQQLRESVEYENFYEVIDTMLENNGKLEQEAFIL